MLDNNCEYKFRCLNNDKCWKCYNNILLKLPEDKKKKQLKRKSESNMNKANKKYNDTKDSWKSLEQEVASKLNDIPSIAEARRSRRSGALEWESGDIVDNILHPECKERKGNDLKAGEKSFTIKKEWIEKASKECECTDKTMCLPFRFKNDESIYAVIKFDDLAGLVNSIKAYMLDNEILYKEIAKLTKDKK